MMGRSRRTARRTSRRTSRRVGRRQAAFAAAAEQTQEAAPPETAQPQAEAPQAKSYAQELEELAALKDKGILTSITGIYSCVIRLTPPLTITKDHVDKFIQALDDTLKE